MAIVESIQKELEAEKYFTGVFVDLKKAFDTVDHNILLEKLDFYGTKVSKFFLLLTSSQKKTKHKMDMQRAYT